MLLTLQVKFCFGREDNYVPLPEGNIVFWCNPIGVGAGVRLSCLHNILLPEVGDLNFPGYIIGT